MKNLHRYLSNLAMNVAVAVTNGTVVGVDISGVPTTLRTDKCGGSSGGGC
ncbi:MAG: hypothetical protein KDJ65_29280 [Anaerolineae bacterium]|nr:hypothetical protein [Anaerolineae bacterium]